MSIFDELKASLQEAVEIKQGNTEASRITRHEVANGRAIRAKLHVSATRSLVIDWSFVRKISTKAAF